MNTYATQMEAAKHGIITDEMKTVAKKENRTEEEIRKLIASGQAVICANKRHKCLAPAAVGSMLTTKINVTPAEHLALPDLEDMRQGIIASKIAAHAADIAKHIPHAREIDDKMADARRKLDWEKQWECAIYPETARKIRDRRKPELEETCSMCAKFCAVRSMNKALNGETVDIL